MASKCPVWSDSIEDAHLVAGLGSALLPVEHRRGDAADRIAGFDRTAEVDPCLDAQLLQTGRRIRRADDRRERSRPHRIRAAASRKRARARRAECAVARRMTLRRRTCPPCPHWRHPPSAGRGSSTASMEAAALARSGSSSSSAPAAIRFSSVRLLSVRGLIRRAKSARSRKGSLPRASSSASMACRPTPLMAASA